MEVKIALGNVVQEILSVAQETHAGLIVLGVHAPAHSWLPGPNRLLTRFWWRRRAR